ncbi:MAG: hypothetical protein EOM87_04885, partial [Clostridia bacterium]|nr:hypothetical protein [Clostridia bacterium]
MEKFNVGLKWYINGEINEYDPENPPIYDGIAQSLIAKGLGVVYFKRVGTPGSYTYVPTTVSVPLETDEYDEFGNRQWEAIKAGDNYQATVTRINPSAIDITAYYDEFGTPYNYDDCYYSYNYELPIEGTSLNWRIQKRPLVIEISDGDLVELRKFYNGNSNFIIDEENSTFNFIHSGETIERNGIIIRLYDEIATYKVIGINGYNEFSYIIKGIIESDSYAKHKCPVCGFVYQETDFNSYSVEDSSDKGYSIVTNVAGTRWEDLPSDYQCPKCKKESAEEAARLIDNLYQLVMLEAANNGVMEYVILAKLIDALYEAAQTAISNNLGELAYAAAKAAYNAVNYVDDSIMNITKYTAVQIGQLLGDAVKCMVDNLPAPPGTLGGTSDYTFMDYSSVTAIYN